MTGTIIRVGLIGSAIQGSSSPSLHAQEAAALGLSLEYRLFDLDGLGGPSALSSVVQRLVDEGYAGCNVTYPVKQTVLPLLDLLAPEAQAIGAVNTVLFHPDGTREGHNTDWTGFGENLRAELGDGPLGRIALIGAGGAGAAAAYALARHGVEHVTVLDSDPRRAGELVERIRSYGVDAIQATLYAMSRTLCTCDGIVQATPVGMAKLPGMPLDPADLRSDMWVAEIIYVPAETELLRRARSAGCRTVSGVGMVIRQAARAFELFTGTRPDVTRMQRSFQSMEPA